MKTTNTTALIFTCLAMIACSPDTTPKTKLFEEERSALEKAKAVESTVQQQTQQLQQNVEQQNAGQQSQ